MKKLPEKVLQGLRTFNQGGFYQAHEYFEDAWRNTPNEDRELFKALLHLSGGYYRLTQNRPSAARKFFTFSLDWISKFPSPYLGLAISEIKTQLENLIRAIDAGQSSQSILQQYRFHIEPINKKQQP
jgi:predicted metal-dependent hydrolase